MARVKIRSVYKYTYPILYVLVHDDEVYRKEKPNNTYRFYSNSHLAHFTVLNETILSQSRRIHFNIKLISFLI